MSSHKDLAHWGCSMNHGAEGRVVVITGSSSGFGLLAAVAFAQCGDVVHATVRTDAGRRRLLEAAMALGVGVRPVEVDVTDPGRLEEVLDAIIDEWGPVDVAVNNAGVACSGALETMRLDTLRLVWETNFFAPVRLIRRVLPGMRARGSGHIVNVSSMSGRLPAQPITWSYDTTKHALSSMSEALAHEVAPFGIVVRCIEPAFFRTDILSKKFRDVEETGVLDSSPYAPTERAVDGWIARQVAGRRSSAGDRRDYRRKHGNRSVAGARACRRDGARGARSILGPG